MIPIQEPLTEEKSPFKHLLVALVFLVFALYCLKEILSDRIWDINKVHWHWRTDAGVIFIFIVSFFGFIYKLRKSVSLYKSKNESSSKQILEGDGKHNGCSN